MYIENTDNLDKKHTSDKIDEIDVRDHMLQHFDKIIDSISKIIKETERKRYGHL